MWLSKSFRNFWRTFEFCEVKNLNYKKSDGKWSSVLIKQWSLQKLLLTTDCVHHLKSLDKIENEKQISSNSLKISYKWEEEE